MSRGRRCVSRALGRLTGRIGSPRPADALAALRPKPYLAVSVLAFLWLSVGNFSLPLGAFTACSSNASNSFATAADWVAPQVDRTVIAKQTGYSAAYIQQGASFYVYANITDSGNPASGISTVRTDVSNIDSGVTSWPLTSGSYSAEGVSYNYRSGILHADATLSEGSKSYTITTTDLASNSDTKTGYSVTIDNTIPWIADSQTTNNSGGTVGKAEQGDTAIFTFDDPMDPESMLSGWDGSSTNIVVRLNNNGSNDVLKPYDSTNTTRIEGAKELRLKGNYVAGNRTFGATGTPSTMVMSGSTVTVTLGTASGSVLTETVPNYMLWVPGTSPNAYDRAGNLMNNANRYEFGASDVEF